MTINFMWLTKIITMYLYVTFYIPLGTVFPCVFGMHATLFTQWVLGTHKAFEILQNSFG
jgi:hypothetical protein